MPIKKRKTKAADKEICYHEHRALQWAAQPKDGVDFHANKRNGKPFTEVMLQPKRNLFFKDIWHCPTKDDAKRVARAILEYDDIDQVELKGTWVWVSWHHQGKGFELPGQDGDDREKVTG